MYDISPTHIKYLFVPQAKSPSVITPMLSLQIAVCCFSVLMCSAGLSMNRWSLEEMVKRDPDNFLILLQQIIRKTKEVRPQRSKWIHCPLDVLWGNGSLLSVCLQVQEQCQYELVAPLAIMFSSTLLQVQTVIQWLPKPPSLISAVYLQIKLLVVYNQCFVRC